MANIIFTNAVECLVERAAGNLSVSAVEALDQIGREAAQAGSDKITVHLPAPRKAARLTVKVTARSDDSLVVSLPGEAGV